MRLIQDHEIQDPAVLDSLRRIRSKNVGAICREWLPVGGQDGTLYEVRAIRSGMPVFGMRCASLRDAAATVAQKVAPESWVAV